jgi:hypothetical protein
MTIPRKRRLEPVPHEPSHRRIWRSLWRRCSCGLPAPCVDRLVPAPRLPFPPTGVPPAPARTVRGSDQPRRPATADDSGQVGHEPATGRRPTWTARGHTSPAAAASTANWYATAPAASGGWPENTIGTATPRYSARPSDHAYPVGGSIRSSAAWPTGEADRGEADRGEASIRGRTRFPDDVVRSSGRTAWPSVRARSDTGWVDEFDRSRAAGGSDWPGERDGPVQRCQGSAVDGTPWGVPPSDPPEAAWRAGAECPESAGSKRISDGTEQKDGPESAAWQTLASLPPPSPTDPNRCGTGPGAWLTSDAGTLGTAGHASGTSAPDGASLTRETVAEDEARWFARATDVNDEANAKGDAKPASETLAGDGPWPAYSTVAGNRSWPPLSETLPEDAAWRPSADSPSGDINPRRRSPGGQQVRAPAWDAPTVLLSQVGRAGDLTPAQAYRAGRGRSW